MQLHSKKGLSLIKCVCEYIWNKKRQIQLHLFWIEFFWKKWNSQKLSATSFKERSQSNKMCAHIWNKKVKLSCIFFGLNFSKRNEIEKSATSFKLVSVYNGLVCVYLCIKKAKLNFFRFKFSKRNQIPRNWVQLRWNEMIESMNLLRFRLNCAIGNWDWNY